MYRCAQSVRTSHMMLHAHAWLKLKFKSCLPQNSHSISCAKSHAMHGTRSTSSSFSSVPGLQRLLTSRNPCADSRERVSDGYTDPKPLTGLSHSSPFTFQPSTWCPVRAFSCFPGLRFSFVFFTTVVVANALLMWYASYGQSCVALQQFPLPPRSRVKENEIERYLVCNLWNTSEKRKDQANGQMQFDAGEKDP